MIGPTSPRLRRSPSIASATPGCWTLTATSAPSSVRARWTWPSEASANGSSSKSENSSADGRVELALDDAPHAVERDRRRARSQRAERASGALALESEHREELHELGPRALHPPELSPELLDQGEGLRVAARRRPLSVRRHCARICPRRRAGAPPSGRRSTRDGSVVSMKSLSTRTKRSGSSRCGKCPAPGKTSSRLPATSSVRGAPVIDRDDRVALAPDDEERDRLGEVETVRGVDPLAPDVDDRPQRVQERRARLAVGERRVAAQDLADVGVHAQPDAAEQAPDEPAGAHDAIVDQERQHELRARKAGGAQQGADLPAQAAAAHEDQPLAVLGELVGELHRDAAAQRVPDEGRAIVPQRQQQVADPAGVGAQRVVAAGLGRLAVAEQIGRDDGEALGEVREHVGPRGRRRRDPVDEHERRPAAGRAEEDAMAVQDDLAQLVVRGGSHQGAAIRATVRKWTPSRPSSEKPIGRARRRRRGRASVGASARPGLRRCRTERRRPCRAGRRSGPAAARRPSGRSGSCRHSSPPTGRTRAGRGRP